MMNIDKKESTLKELGLKDKRVEIGFRLHIAYRLNSEDVFLLDHDSKSLVFDDKATAEETAKQLEQQYKEYYKEDKPYFHYIIYELAETVYFK